MMSDLLVTGGIVMVATGAIINECGGSKKSGYLWSACGAIMLIWNVFMYWGLI